MPQPSRIRALGSEETPSSEQFSIPLCDDLRPLRSHSLVTGSSDADLIAAVIAGNIDSFSLLVQRHQDTCVRYAVRMLGSRVDADDVLQSAFMRAFRNLRSCRDRDRFGGWLYQIVVNECRTFATRRRRREQRFLSATGEIERAIAPGSDEPADRDFGGHIERALSLLPADQREAFLLKHVEELTYEEISEMTGASVSALKMRVKRAADSLRDLLDGVYNG
ncbi:MAG TPA: RNA polymerase sigma factor [Gemmatimonadaceae bacterium]|nr:RNA polymerase sigma factor [Gemmatimonadaceae bacterium]